MKQMKVCQICGDIGYSKRLITCVQCQDVAVHRYCLGGQAILNDKKYKWSCEDCVPRKTGPSLPCKKSERLRPTVERLTGRKNARIKWRNELWASQVENPIGARKETAREATYPTILDHKNKVGSAKAEREKITQQSEDCVDRNKLNANELHINNNNSSRPIVHGLMINHKKSLVGSEKTEGEKITQRLEDCVDRNKLNANELPISNNNSSRPIVQGLMANHKKSVVEDFVHEQQGDVQYSCDDVGNQVTWKKRRLVDTGTDCSSKSSSEALPKLIDDEQPQLIPVELIPNRSYPTKLDDCVLTREQPSIAQPSSLMMVNQVPSQPLMDPLWRGKCIISENERVLSLVLEARLSNTGDGKVQGAVLAMPVSLNFDLVPKKTAWPMSFKEQSPTGGDIGLYFFPCDERNEKLYEHVIDKMIDHGLVLTSYINNLQLLVFCSRELPREEWTFRRKYYIWGVFKQRKDPIMLNKPTNIRTKKVESPIPAKYPSENIYPQKEPSTASPNVYQVKRLPEELTRTVSSKSFKRPRDKKVESPIPAKYPSDNTYLRKEPNTASRNVHQYKRLPEELTRTVSSKSFKRPRDKKEYTNNHQKRDTNFGGSRNDYHRNSKMFSKSQDNGRDRDSGFSNNPPRRENGREWGKCGSTWKDQGSRGDRYSSKPTW